MAPEYRNYGSTYDQSIVRTVLPVIRNSELKNDPLVLQIADGWISNNSFLELDTLDNKDYIIGRIYKTEDNAFINGNDVLGIVGINTTKTIRHDLLNAIKEFNPEYIITSSKYLNPRGMKVFRWPELDKNVHYLIPKGITNKEAEFIISEEMTETFSDYHYKQYWHELHEWVKFGIYKPDFFVKVCKNLSKEV